jgi:hypothetical protein
MVMCAVVSVMVYISAICSLCYISALRNLFILVLYVTCLY